MPSLARSVPKSLKVPSLARSVPKPLKVPSLARSVPKPLLIELKEAGGHQPGNMECSRREGGACAFMIFWRVCSRDGWCAVASEGVQSRRRVCSNSEGVQQFGGCAANRRVCSKVKVCAKIMDGVQ